MVGADNRLLAVRFCNLPSLASSDWPKSWGLQNKWEPIVMATKKTICPILAFAMPLGITMRNGEAALERACYPFSSWRLAIALDDATVQASYSLSKYSRRERCLCFSRFSELMNFGAFDVSARRGCNHTALWATTGDIRDIWVILKVIFVN